MSTTKFKNDNSENTIKSPEELIRIVEGELNKSAEEQSAREFRGWIVNTIFVLIAFSTCAWLNILLWNLIR